MAFDSIGKQIAAVGVGGRVSVVSLDGGLARDLGGFSEKANLLAVAFDRDGQRVAAAPFLGPIGDKVIRVWDLRTGDAQVLGPVPYAGDGWEGGIVSLAFPGSGPRFWRASTRRRGGSVRVWRSLICAAERARCCPRSPSCPSSAPQRVVSGWG